MKFVLWAPFRGRVGTIEAMLEYARTLSEEGHSVTIVEMTDEWEPYKTEIAEIPGRVQLLAIFHGRIARSVGTTNILHRRDFFLLSFFAAMRMKKILDHLRPDYVISGLLTAPLLLFIGSVWRKKVIVSVQGYPKFLLVDQSAYYRFENCLRSKAWQSLYRGVHAILTMTDDTRRRLVEMISLDPGSVVCVPNPILSVLERVYEEGNPLLPNMDGSADVVFVGRLDEQKNPEKFVETAAEFVHLDPSVRFVMFGNGPLEKSLRAEVERTGANVLFCGHVEEPWRQVRQGSIFLCTSRWEDPGHAIIEAMAFRVPVVVVDRNASHLELAADGRAIVVGDSANEIAHAINQILSLGMPRPMIDSAEQYVNRRFSREPLKEFLNVCC